MFCPIVLVHKVIISISSVYTNIQCLFIDVMNRFNKVPQCLFKEFSLGGGGGGGGGAKQEKKQNEKYEPSRFGERASLKRDFVKF